LFVGELAQAHRYLTDPDLRDATDARLDATVGADCRVVIGHSLGSIVALEHLRRHPDRRIELLLVLGSPLGLRAVRHLLPDAAFGTGPDGPPNARWWIALRDPRDPVALAGPLARWWPCVDDDATIDNGRRAHASLRYLSKLQTGLAVDRACPATT
jgi:pimeloyl-ACP methyl ester carboxylesterase